MNNPYFSIILLFGAMCLFQCSKEPINRANPSSSLPDNVYTYLERNRFPIDPAENSTYQFLSDAMLNQNSVIFSGESHAISNNGSVELGFIKYLTNKGWLDYYMPELPYSFCYLLNEYLKTGEQSTLDTLFQPLEGTFFWTKEQYRKMIDLYTFNQTLPAEHKIQVVGIEIEHQPTNTLWALTRMVAKGNNSNYLLDELHQLRRKSSVSNKEIYDLTTRIERAIAGNPNRYMTLLGPEFPFFKHLIRANNRTNIVRETATDESYRLDRERAISQNFNALAVLLPEGNWYGQWGAWHVNKTPINNEMTIAAYLNTHLDSPKKGVVLTLLNLYNNSQHLLKSPYRTQDYSNVPDSGSFTKLSMGPITLFTLKGMDSPFQSNTSLLQQFGISANGVVTDYYDFLILNEGIAASSPLR